MAGLRCQCMQCDKPTAEWKENLLSACTLGHTECVSELLADTLGAGLYAAAKAGHTNTVAVLLKSAAEVNYIGPKQRTPLIAAALYNCTTFGYTH